MHATIIQTALDLFLKSCYLYDLCAYYTFIYSPSDLIDTLKTINLHDCVEKYVTLSQ